MSLTHSPVATSDIGKSRGSSRLDKSVTDSSGALRGGVRSIDDAYESTCRSHQNTSFR